MSRPADPSRIRRHGTTFALVVGLLCLSIGRTAGQDRHQDIEATFLYNFAKFVEWPKASLSDSVTSFRIEIIGRDPFDGRFDRLMIGKTVFGRRIDVIHSLGEPSPTPVHMAFVSTSETKRVEALLTAYRQTHVLTVSDIPGFTGRGGMIGFTPEPGGVRFTINRAAVQQAQLQMSSRLLALGR